MDSRAPDLPIDEIVQLLLTEISRLNATRVVTTLTSVGVSVLLTSELEDRYTDLRFSPYGTAFLTDAKIVTSGLSSLVVLDSRDPFYAAYSSIRSGTV